DDLRAWVGEGPAVTDDRPTIERFLGERNDPFSVEPLLTRRTPVERLLAGPVDHVALAESQRKIADLWRAADVAAAGDPRAAAAAVDDALEIAPADPYLRYRLREYQSRARE